MTDLLDLVAWALLLLFAACVASTAYLWRVYLRSPFLRNPVGRPHLFRDWAVVSTIVTVASGLTMWPALRLVLDLPRASGAGYLVVPALLMVFTIPLYFAQRVYRLRRRGLAHNVPPPGAGPFETTDQREDRQFGEARRDLEQEHLADE